MLTLRICIAYALGGFTGGLVMVIVSNIMNLHPPVNPLLGGIIGALAMSLAYILSAFPQSKRWRAILFGSVLGVVVSLLYYTSIAPESGVAVGAMIGCIVGGFTFQYYIERMRDRVQAE